MPINRDGFDEFGNPIGRAFDLGGVDDERLRGEKILLYGPRWLTDWHLVMQAVKERNLDVELVLAANRKCPLTKREIEPYSQIWLVSDEVVTLSQEQVDLICRHTEAGNGLFIIADNDPLFADANLIAERLVGTRFSGNKLAEGILVPSRELRPGVFIEHQLTQGINQLWEGTTICSVSPASHLTILAMSRDGQNSIACYDHQNRRIVLDTGFTKFHNIFFKKTAGTPRYLRNIAFWLAKGSRGIEYIPFTPGRESIARINAGTSSERYRYALDEPANLTYLLHWEGAGTLGLVVQNPQGHIVHDSASAKSPIRVEIPATATGDWVCWVKGIRVAHPNFPYVLTLARSALSTSPKSSKPKARIEPALLSRQGMYDKQWGSTHPGLLIILLDQSSSMNDTFGSSQIGAGKRKCDAVATFLNNLLYEFIRSNTVGADLKPRADVAILSYEGGTARSVLKGTLAGKPFVSLPELNASPLRVETRSKKELADDGTVIEIPTQFPVWVEAMVGTATPMCTALRQARELAESWMKQHPHNYPPVVINITDGASTDGDPREAAQELCEIGTSDGKVLLFNVYLTDKPIPTIEFPNQVGQIPADADDLGVTLFEMSSEIPASARRNITGTTGQELATGARGLILNGDAGSVRQMFVFATVGASPAVDPNR